MSKKGGQLALYGKAYNPRMWDDIPLTKKSERKMIRTREEDFLENRTRSKGNPNKPNCSSTFRPETS